MHMRMKPSIYGSCLLLPLGLQRPADANSKHHFSGKGRESHFVHQTLDTRKLVSNLRYLILFVLAFMPEPISIVEPTGPPLRQPFDGTQIPVALPAAVPRGLVIQL